MRPLVRIGDVGDGVCRAGHEDVEEGDDKPMITTLITGAATVFTNFLMQTTVGSVGSTDCGHTTTEITGSPTVFAEFMPVTRLGDYGEVNEGAGGEYTTVSASSNVFAG